MWGTPERLIVVFWARRASLAERAVKALLAECAAEARLTRLPREAVRRLKALLATRAAGELLVEGPEKQ